ncbi:MAG: hypothetical protein LBI91_01060 [Spirochaetaceae bacterium]|jgi:hypothetical protein|nr:hypothetical protein [Spirochaetaceae bacterium]
MSSGRLFWVLGFISFAALVPASAYTVSFVVAEIGIPEGQGVSEYSNFWESGLLDVFFDAGHIVSNGHVLRLGAPPAKQFPDEAAETLSEANAGGADYFILALLDYRVSGAPDTSPIPKPKQVSLRLFKTNPFRFIREEKFAGFQEPRAGEDFISAKRAAMKILPYLE